MRTVIQLTAVGDRSDDVLRVDQRELGGNVEIGTRHRARTLRRHMRRGFLDIIVQCGEHKTLDIQDDIGDILDDAFGRRELMLHTLDLDGGGFRTIQRGEQNAAHAVAQRVAVATLERLENKSSVGSVRLHFSRLNSWLFNFNQSKPSL